MNIFDSGADYLVNPVNTVGVMGKGLALEFSKRRPGLLVAYKQACVQGVLSTHQPWIYKDVVCFATKQHWRNPSQLEWIKEGLSNLVIPEGKSIAFPRLGCGLGGLDWNEVKPLIDNWELNNPTNKVIYCG